MSSILEDGMYGMVIIVLQVLLEFHFECFLT